MSSGRHRATAPSAHFSRPLRPAAARPAIGAPRRTRSTFTAAPAIAPTVATRRDAPGTGLRRAAATSTAIVAAAGLSLTMVVPANAATLDSTGDTADTAAISTIPSGDVTTTHGQTMRVASTITTVSTARDGFSSSAPAATPRAVAVAKAAAVTTILSTSTSTAADATAVAGATTTASASSSGAAVGEQIVAAAEEYVGKVPYVIDGSTPSTGFDCSGLVQYVFAEFGIPMQHDVDAEAALGTVVSASEARPGDLVVYPHEHIGIYVGSGDMVNAPHVGLDVQVQAVWGSPSYVRIPNT